MVINGKEYTRENIGKIFDYALLSSDVTQSMVEEHVKRAIRYNVNGVYCNPHWVPLIADMLDGTGIETGLVPDFPFGAATTKMKLHELKEMCEIMKGRPAAIDFVINIAALKDGKYDLFFNEAKEIVDMGHSYGYQVKAIMENASLSDQEIAMGCQYVSKAGVDWVKAATGRAASPRMDTIKIMRANIPDHVRIKFAGYGTYGLTQLTIMGLVTGAELFGTGYAHEIIEEIEKNYKNLVIHTK